MREKLEEKRESVRISSSYLLHFIFTHTHFHTHTLSHSHTSTHSITSHLPQRRWTVSWEKWENHSFALTHTQSQTMKVVIIHAPHTHTHPPLPHKHTKTIYTSYLIFAFRISENHERGILSHSLSFIGLTQLHTHTHTHTHTAR